MTKTFDAIEMKRRGSEKVYQQIAHLTPAQQLAFWQQRTLALQERQKAAKTKRQSSAPA